MNGIALKYQWGKLITMVNSIDGFIMLVGFVAIGALWILESTAWRLICFIIAAVSGLLFIVSMQSKRSELRRGFSISNSPLPSQEEGSDMKKLVFDDFQLHPRATPVTEETQQIEESQTPVPVTHLRRIPQSGTAKMNPAARDFQLSDFFDVDSDLFKGTTPESSPDPVVRAGNQPELRNEFDFLLNKVLVVIKDVVFAHTVAFFWANRDKQQMVCEARMTDSMSFLSSRRFAMGHDIVSNIARSGKPELITHVNPSSEKELLRYYEQVEFVKSFVGVPVFYPALVNESRPGGTSEPVGVIVADSTMEDAFGQETIALLGQFTKLISALIKTSTDKYDLLLDVELLNAIRRLQERIRNDFSVQTIAQTLAEESGKLLNWSFFSVVLYDEVKRGWATKKIANRIQESYVSPEQLIDFDESIVGNAIKNNTHQLVQDLETQSAEGRPRYYHGEKLVNNGSFVSVPISSLNKCYGALNVESRDRFNFSRKDIEILYRLTENAASALEILYLNDMIKEYVVIDDTTSAYSKKFFLKKLHEELLRADDYGTELSLLLVSVDHSNKIIDRYGQEGFETVLTDIVKILRAGSRPYDAVGRYDYNRFGIILVNTTANDAYIWAEKMRKTIASHIIVINGKNFSATVSIGVCGALEGMKTEEILDHATAVLHKGMEAGGNSVRVY